MEWPTTAPSSSKGCAAAVCRSTSLLPTPVDSLPALRALPHPPTAARVRALAREVADYDLLHVQFAVSAFHTRTPALMRLLEAAEVNGIPVAITMHEVARDLDLLGPLAVTLYRRLAARSALTVVHTDTARRRLIDQVGAESRPGNGGPALSAPTSGRLDIRRPRPAAAARHPQHRPGRTFIWIRPR